MGYVTSYQPRNGVTQHYVTHVTHVVSWFELTVLSCSQGTVTHIAAGLASHTHGWAGWLWVCRQ